MHGDSKRERYPNEDHKNLIALGETDDLRAAHDGVGDHEAAREPDGEIQIQPSRTERIMAGA